tara:strand:- start:179 stop:688 length:510 start_codon:yes stop_codon:yes gene_type:complete
MKTYKQFNESIVKALKAFGSKGIRKVEPNIIATEFGKTTKRFNPDMNLKQFNRTQDLKRKYKSVDTPYKKGLMMKQKMVGVQAGDPFEIGANLKKEPVLNRLARQGKPDMLDANVNLQKKYTDRKLDRMQGFPPTESGPNTETQEKLSKGKGTKSRKRAIELLKSRIKD